MKPVHKWILPQYHWNCAKAQTWPNKTDQQIFMSNFNPSGHEVGIGRLSELLPTPQIMADVSTSLYGTSWVIISHSSTPYDL